MKKNVCVCACVRVCVCVCVFVCARIRDHETIRSLRLTSEELHRLEDFDDGVSLNLS